MLKFSGCHGRDCMVVHKNNTFCISYLNNNITVKMQKFSGRDIKVVGFTTIYAISAYHQFESCLRRDVLNTTLCDKVCL